MSTSLGNGKIARLPAQIREEVNRRLHDGQPQSVILPWLNALPEVVAILDAHFEGEEISPQNLSAWRTNGFFKWQQQERQIRRTRERAAHALEIAKASGGNLAQGALAALTGEVIDMVEELAELRESGQEIDAKAFAAIGKVLATARGKEIESHTLALNERRLDQNERRLALDEEKFQLATCEKFAAWFKDESARRIVESGEKKEVKMEQLRLLLFGKRPEPAAPAA